MNGIFFWYSLVGKYTFSSHGIRTFSNSWDPISAPCQSTARRVRGHPDGVPAKDPGGISHMESHGFLWIEIQWIWSRWLKPWPFDPLLGGHQQPLKGSPTIIPERSLNRRIARVWAIFLLMIFLKGMIKTLYTWNQRWQKWPPTDIGDKRVMTWITWWTKNSRSPFPWGSEDH